MGDVLSLIEEIESKVDRDQAEKLALLKKVTDLIQRLPEQLKQMRNMGGMAWDADQTAGHVSGAGRGEIADG